MPESERTRQVRVTYRRYVSDGNYGTEGFEVSLDWFIEDMDSSHDDLEAADEMMRNARDLVLAKLLDSNNPNVRRNAVPRTTTSPSTAATVPSDDDEESLPF